MASDNTQDPTAAPPANPLDAFLSAPAPKAGSPEPAPSVSPTAAPPAAPAGETAGGAGEAGVLGAADTLSAGFLDEMAGYVAPLAPGTGRENIYNSNKSYGELVAAETARARAIEAADSSAHPAATIGGGLAGGLLVPFGAGAKGALEVAKVGAVLGAAHGVGSGEGVEGRLEEGAKEGVIGGVLGAALGKVTDVASPYVSKALEAVGLKKPPVTEDLPQGRPGKLMVDITPNGEPQPTTVPDPAGTIQATTTDGQPVLPATVENPDVVHIGETGAEHAPAPAEDSKAVAKSGGSGGGGEEPPAPTSLEATPEEGGSGYGASIERSGLKALQDAAEAFKARVANGGNDSRLLDINPENAPGVAERVGNFRIGNIGDGGLDTAGLLRAVSTTLPDSGVKSDGELMLTARAMARDVGDDPEAILSAAKALAGQLGSADNMMATMRTLWRNSADTISTLHKQGIDWDTASDEMVQHGAQQIRNLSQLSQYVQQAKVGLGRGLRVNSLPDSESFLNAIKEGVPLSGTGNREAPAVPTTRDQIKDWLDNWALAGDDRQAQAGWLQRTLTVPSASKYLRTSIANAFTASILSAPRTVLLNLAGPGFVHVMTSWERMSGGAAVGISPFASAEERAAGREVAKQSASAFARTLGDVADVFRAHSIFTSGLRSGLTREEALAQPGMSEIYTRSAQAAAQAHGVMGGGGSAVDTLGNYGPINDNLLNAANVDPSWMYSLGNAINVFPKGFARINAGLDEMAKRLTAQGFIRLSAQTEAAQGGLEGQAARDFVTDKLTNSYDETGHIADEEVLRAAENTTFTATPGEEGSWVRNFSQGLQRLRADVPEVRFIVPVFNVAANSLGATVRRLPILGMLRGGEAFQRDAAELAGEHGPVLQAEAHGRWLLGASFLTAGMLMNRAGLLTGAGPQESTDRKVWLQTHQPYSIRVGDHWVRYDKADIMSGLLSIPASLGDATVYRPGDKSMSDMMWSGVGALAQWFMDKAALKSATGLLSLGQDPMHDTSHFATQFGGSIASALVPNAVQTTVTATHDPYLRLKNTWSDYLRNAIPGLSTQLEPVRNVLGEPMRRAADSYSDAIMPFTTAPATSFQKDPVLDEMDRLYQQTGYGAGADPRSLSYGTFDPRDVKLEDGKSLYNAFMQARQTMTLNGKTLRQSLGDLFQSPAYQNGVDADSQQARTSRGDLSRGYMAKVVFEHYNAAIKADLAKASPTAMKWLTAAAAKQRDDAYLKTTSAADLVANPALYASHGINPAGYQQKLTSGASGELLQALGQ